MRELKIPKSRIAVLIGSNGSVKKSLENKLKIKLSVSKEGDVILEGDELKTYLAESIIRAIGRGFNPAIAIKLTNEENCFELVDIITFTGKSKKKFIRIKARVIGKQGRARETVENLTHTNIVVYGKTVAIIGRFEDVIIAKAAIEKLLGGSPHGNAYKYIEGEIKKKKWQ